MKYHELIQQDKDKYTVIYNGEEMSNFEALDIIKSNANIIYFDSKDCYSFESLGVKDYITKKPDNTIVLGFLDALIKNGDFYNMIVLVKGVFGITSVMVGLKNRPIIKKEGEKITDIIF